jgi:plastocyanin
VTFQNPPAPVANIGDRSSGSDSRTFQQTGTYNYFCSIHGNAMSGTIIVH